MPLVIDTYNNYFLYLQYRRSTVSATVKANKLALSYFSKLYGYMDTRELQAVHMTRFRETLEQTKRLQKNEKGEYVNLSEYSIYKILGKLRAYVRWLESEKLLWDLKPIDVPLWHVPCPVPKYLTKEELRTILKHLDKQVEESETITNPVMIYNAYLHRAIVWFLYTTGVRNAELRNLKKQDINVDKLLWAVLGKGNKYAAITFSEMTKNHLLAYLDVRAKMFPGKDFKYVFTSYTSNTDVPLTEQWLNSMVKRIGVKAGVSTKTNTHTYRHTLATHMIEDGYTIVQVRDKLRHSSVSITNGYAHSNPTDQLAVTTTIDANISL